MGNFLHTIGSRWRRSGQVFGAVALAVTFAACSSDASTTSSSDAGSDNEGERPQIVVTTSILGDVVTEAVGDQADVEVIMAPGSDPHDFAPSASQAEAMENADLLVVNGANFEEGMLDIIKNVTDSGTEVFSFAEQVELIENEEGDKHSEDEGHSDEEGDKHSDEEEGHSDEEGDKHSDEEGDKHSDEEEGHSDEEGDKHSDEEEGHSDEEGDEHSDEEEGHEGHDHGAEDPHIWTDPTVITTAVEALEPAVAKIDGVDADELSTSFDAYLDELAALDTSMEETLADVPDANRVLVTDHEVFAYFAERFEFEVVGAVIPSLSTNAEPSAADLDELAEVIETEDIPAIFADTTGNSNLPEALAEQVDGDVEVVALFSETLGEDGSGAETYLAMMQLNADLIAEALAA